MRILMTTDSIGGVWTYTVELASALAARGVAVTLACMGAPLSAAQRAEAAAAQLVVHESSYRLEWMQDSWADVTAAGAWLLDLAEATAPDVVHLNGYGHAALPWGVPVVVVAHSCVCSWWRAVHGRPAPEPEWARYRRAVAEALEVADLLVAPTRALVTAMQREYGTMAGVRVIANGRSWPRPARGRKEPFVLTAGRLWDPAKNLATLRAAAPAVPWPIVVAGAIEAPDGQPCDPSPLHALGPLGQQEVRARMDGASIYAAPARYEPFGLAILEAAQAGCALVLGDIPSLRELWEGAAVFVPPGEPAAWAAALSALADHAGERASWSARAGERALRFTPDAMADAYLDAYRSLDRHREHRAICA